MGIGRLKSGTEIAGTVWPSAAREINGPEGTLIVTDALVMHPPTSRDDVCWHFAHVQVAMTQPLPRVKVDFKAKYNGSLGRDLSSLARARRVVLVDAFETQGISIDESEAPRETPVSTTVRKLLGWTKPPLEQSALQISLPAQAMKFARSELLRRKVGPDVWIPIRITPTSTVLVWANGSSQFRASGERSLNSPDLQLAARASIEFLRDEGDGVLNLRGVSEDYKVCMWAHARLMGIEVNGYWPSRAELVTAERYLEDLRAMYASQRVVLRPYVPPQVPRNSNQFLFLARRQPRHKRLTLVKS